MYVVVVVVVDLELDEGEEEDGGVSGFPSVTSVKKSDDGEVGEVWGRGSMK